MTTTSTTPNPIPTQTTQPQKLSGIDPKRVVNKEYLNSLGDFYKCSICFNVMVNPTDCEKCGHSYCNECISRLKCPYNCESKTLKPSSMGIKALLSNLFFSCENENCQLKIAYSNVQSHDLSCEYQKITCPSTGCNLQLARKDLEKHIKDECVYSLLNCKYCGYDFVRSKIEEHQSACLSIYTVLNGDSTIDIANMNIDPKKYLQALSLNISKLIKESNRPRVRIEEDTEKEKDKDKDKDKEYDKESEYKKAEVIASIVETILEKRNMLSSGSIAIGGDGNSDNINNNTMSNMSNTSLMNLNAQTISKELKEEMDKKMVLFEKNLDGLNLTLEELKRMIIEKANQEKELRLKLEEKEKEKEDEEEMQKGIKEDAVQKNQSIMATLLEKVLNETEAKLTNTIIQLSSDFKSQMQYSEKLNTKIDSIQNEITQSQNTQKELKEIITTQPPSQSLSQSQNQIQSDIQTQSQSQLLSQLQTQIENQLQQLRPQIEIKEIEKVITVLPELDFNDYFSKLIQLIEQTNTSIMNYHQELTNQIQSIGIKIDNLELAIPKEVNSIMARLETIDNVITSSSKIESNVIFKEEEKDEQILQEEKEKKIIKSMEETETQTDKESEKEIDQKQEPEPEKEEDQEQDQEQEQKQEKERQDELMKEKELEKERENLIREEKRIENISNAIKTEIKEFNTEIKIYISNEIEEKIKAITNTVDGMNIEIISLNKKIKEIKGMISEEFEDITQLINDNNLKSEEKGSEIMKTIELKISQPKTIEVSEEKPQHQHQIQKEYENSIYHCIEFNIDRQIRTSSSLQQQPQQTEEEEGEKESQQVKDIQLQPQPQLPLTLTTEFLANEISTIIQQTILPAITNNNINNNNNNNIPTELPLNELKTAIVSELDVKLQSLESKIEENIDGRLKAMFSLKWCSECEKVDYFYGFIKCSICLNESCKQCVMLCISCKHLVCKNCASCPKCGKPYCQTCRISCQSCNPPRKYCDNCIQPCSFCKKQVCILCIRQCITCKKYTCKECSKTCKICEKHSCFKCDTSKNFRTCFKCSQTACKDCIHLCTFCESETCQKCFVTCYSCKKLACTKCSHSCHSCEEEFCPLCSKDFTKCGKCNKEFCISCIKYLRRCKKCSKSTCKECCNQCKKCKNIFCLDCSIGCDNCNGYMCSNCTYKCVCDMVVFCEKCLLDINPIGPHDCVFWGNDSSCFKGIKSRSKIKLPNDFEVKLFLEKYTVEANLLIGLTDNNRFDEDSVTFIDNVWAFKIRTGEKYSSAKSLEPFYNKECREGYFILIAKKNDNLFFRVNSEDIPFAYTMPKKDYWLYIENDAPINSAYVRFVYIRKI